MTSTDSCSRQGLTKNMRYVHSPARPFDPDILHAQQDLELPPDHPSQDVLKRTRYAVPVNSRSYHAAKAEMQLVAGLNGLDAVFDSEGVNVLFSLADGHQSLPNMVGYPMGQYLFVALCRADGLTIWIGRCRADGCVKGWCAVRRDLHWEEIRRADPSSCHVSQSLVDEPHTLLTSSIPCCSIIRLQERVGSRVWSKAPTTDGYRRSAAVSGTRSRRSQSHRARHTSFRQC